MKTGIRLGLVAGLAMLCGAANAAVVTSQFQVRITITAACTISTAPTLDFGSAGVISANINQTTTFNVQCTNTTPYTVGLDAGTTGGGSIATRLMTSGSATVQYRLYSDPARTTVWGDVAANWQAATGTGASVLYTVYGQVPAQTTPAPGTYTDLVTATVTF
jgi:spore coat protein U-like protein